MREAEVFEKQLAESFRKHGYKPELTSTSSDRGIDILLHSGRETIAVQAKYYSDGNNVGSPTIQKAAGLLQRRDIDGVVVVTTSGFTDEAQTVASNRGVQLLHSTSNGRLNNSGVAGATYESKKAEEIGPGITWEERDGN
ncbi:restriction endonuclease [Halobacterium hubeiense]|uniref:restriction endonuclease n=1 Tax=Halobacterium hubeiense TaxID=1407499 RepID=UPI003C72F5E1